MCLGRELFHLDRLDCDLGASAEDADGIVDAGVVARMLEPQLIVHVDGLLIWRYQPSNDNVLVRWNSACAGFVLAIRGAAIDAELPAQALPVEDHLIGRVAHPEIGRVRFGFDEDFYGRLERSLGGGCLTLL